MLWQNYKMFLLSFFSYPSIRKTVGLFNYPDNEEQSFFCIFFCHASLNNFKIVIF